MAATLADLVADTSSLKRFVVRFNTFNTTTLVEETHYFSDHGLTTRPEEAPPNTHFPGRISLPLTFSRSMFSGSRIGGRALPDFGEIVLNNKDHELDILLVNEADGRDCDVFIGGETDIFTNYFQIFCGLIEAIEADEDSLLIRVQSLAFSLDRVLHQDTYGVSAEDDIEGKPIPECHGQVLNITPVLTDSTGFVFQVHNGQIQAIDAVYDEGVLQTITTDYTVNLTTGHIDFVAAPTGAVTVDVQGSDEGGTYNTQVGDIIQRIVGYRGITSFESGVFASLNTAFSATVGIYVKDPTNTLDALDFLINSAGGFYGFTRTGEMTVGQLTGPGAANTLLGENQIRNTTNLGVERCNLLRNSLMLGADAGTDNYPNFWSADTDWLAIDDITAVDIENQLDYIEVRLNGTPGGDMVLHFESTTEIGASESHIFTTSAFLTLQAGSLTNVDEIHFGFDEYDGGVFQTQVEGPSITPTGTSTRFQFADQIGTAAADTVRPFIEITHSSGAIDLTLRISAPQFEPGRTASTFIPTTTVAVCVPLEDGGSEGEDIPPAIPTISRALLWTRGGESSSGTPSPSVNTHMHRTPGSTGNRRTFTFATWFRRHNIHSDNEYLWWTISGGHPTFDEDSYIGFIRDTNTIRVTFKTFSTEVPRVETTTAFTREDVWTHLVVAVDTTQAAAADRIRIFVNSVEETLDTSMANGQPDQNFDTHFNRQAAHFLGRREFDVDHLNAVMADTYWIDGLALAPSDFTTWTGVNWVPTTYTGSFGTNGFHLDYADNSTVANLGTDVSGTGNSLTVVNFLTTDQTSSDLPTSPVTTL